MHHERTLLAIEILEHEVISLRSPTGIGTRSAGCRQLAIVTSAIYLLDVVPFSQLGINCVRTIILYTDLVLISLLGRNQDNTVGSTATIEGRGSRTFQYGHRLDIVWIDGRDTITEVITAAFASTAKVCIIQRHTIHHIERLVVACHFCITTKEYTGRTRSTTSGVLHYETSHLTRKRIDDIGFLRLGEFLTLHFLQSIAEGLAVSFDTEGGDNHLIQGLTILMHRDFHAISSFHGHRLVTDIAHFERSSRLAIQRKVTIHIGNGTVGCTGHLHASANQGFASGIHHCTLDALVLLNAHRSIVHLGSENGRSRHPHQTCTEQAEKHSFLSHN